MYNIFLCLLINLKNHGNIFSAAMYDNGFSVIKLKDGDEEYEISIDKKEKKQ